MSDEADANTRDKARSRVSARDAGRQGYSTSSDDEEDDDDDEEEEDEDEEVDDDKGTALTLPKISNTEEGFEIADCNTSTVLSPGTSYSTSRRGSESDAITSSSLLSSMSLPLLRATSSTAESRSFL